MEPRGMARAGGPGSRLDAASGRRGRRGLCVPPECCISDPTALRPGLLLSDLLPAGSLSCSRCLIPSHLGLWAARQDHRHSAPQDRSAEALTSSGFLGESQEREEREEPMAPAFLLPVMSQPLVTPWTGYP